MVGRSLVEAVEAVVAVVFTVGRRRRRKTGGRGHMVLWAKSLFLLVAFSFRARLGGGSLDTLLYIRGAAVLYSTYVDTPLSFPRLPFPHMHSCSSGPFECAFFRMRFPLNALSFECAFSRTRFLVNALSFAVPSAGCIFRSSALAFLPLPTAPGVCVHLSTCVYLHVLLVAVGLGSSQWSSVGEQLSTTSPLSGETSVVSPPPPLATLLMVATSATRSRAASELSLLL